MSRGGPRWFLGHRMRLLLARVREKPGVTLPELSKTVGTEGNAADPYANTRRCVYRLEVNGYVRLEPCGRSVRVWPAEKEKTNANK
jgi:hypothetical protein